jgi:hypothetical protein
MKNRTITIILILLSGLFYYSCDKLDAPYATVKKPGGDTTKITQKVLLEDYTGHKCVNCPEASKAAHVLESGYGGKLIVMAVHAGYLAEPSATGEFTADYTTAAGDAWFNTFPGFIGNPLGMVDRQPYLGKVVLGPDQWANAIDSLIIMAPVAGLEISNTLDTVLGELRVQTETKFLAKLAGKYSLTLCILEDSLISAQKNNNPEIDSTPIIHHYVFMDVLRTTITGTWGEELTTVVDTATTYKKDYIFAFDPTWVPKNCSLVGFISNEDTRGIIQAEKVKVSIK